MDFEEVVDSLKRIKGWLTNINSRRVVIDRGWDIERLKDVFDDVEGISGWEKLRNKVNLGLKQEYVDLGPLYEVEVVSHLKRKGAVIEEVEQDFILNGKTGDIDIVAKLNGEKIFIECKRRIGKISKEQLLKEAEYANRKGVKKLIVYYSRDTTSVRKHYEIKEAIQEAKAKYGVEVRLEHYGSEFN